MIETSKTGLTVRIRIEDAAGDSGRSLTAAIEELMARLKSVGSWQLTDDSVQLTRSPEERLISFRIGDDAAFVTNMKDLLSTAPLRDCVTVWIEDLPAEGGPMWRELDLGFGGPGV